MLQNEKLKLRVTQWSVSGLPWNSVRCGQHSPLFSFLFLFLSPALRSLPGTFRRKPYRIAGEEAREDGRALGELRQI